MKNENNFKNIFDLSYDVTKDANALIVDWVKTNTNSDLMSFLHGSKDIQILIGSDDYKIKRVVSNKETFNFGLLLENDGKFKNLTIVNHSGIWLANIKTIKLKEKDKLVWRDASSFKYLIHPLKFNMMFGKKYIYAKLLIDRLEKEAKYYYSCMKGMLSLDDTFKDTIKTKKDATQKVEKIIDEIPAMVIKVETPFQWVNTFEKYKPSIQTFNKLKKKRDNIIYNLLPTLQTYVRMIEFSHWKTDGKASWIKTNWESHKKDMRILVLDEVWLNKKEYVTKKRRLKMEI